MENKVLKDKISKNERDIADLKKDLTQNASRFSSFEKDKIWLETKSNKMQRDAEDLQKKLKVLNDKTNIMQFSDMQKDFARMKAEMGELSESMSRSLSELSTI